MDDLRVLLAVFNFADTLDESGKKYNKVFEIAAPEEMLKDQNTYYDTEWGVEWDVDTIWVMDADKNEGYPCLQWQN